MGNVSNIFHLRCIKRLLVLSSQQQIVDGILTAKVSSHTLLTAGLELSGKQIQKRNDSLLAGWAAIWLEGELFSYISSHLTPNEIKN